MASDTTPPTPKELEFIINNFRKMTITNLCNQIFNISGRKRTKYWLEKQIGEILGQESSSKKVDSSERLLKESVYWEQIKRQLSPEEQKVFVEHWKEIIKQFKNDVFYTEYIQIIDVIKLELLANRILEEQQACRTSIKNLETLIENQMQKTPKERDENIIATCESSIVANRNVAKAVDKQYLDILNEKKSYMNGLKATREQRIKMVENGKVNFQDWMKAIITSPELRHDVGIAAEKMRIAMEEERKKLSEYYTFLDNEVDRPLLNSDTVTEEDKR